MLRLTVRVGGWARRASIAAGRARGCARRASRAAARAMAVGRTCVDVRRAARAAVAWGVCANREVSMLRRAPNR